MELKRPKFSIIVPLYNKSAYIEKALNSILSQSFKDWELIVVDDGSTDGSASIAKEMIAEDSRCRFVSQANSGVAYSRNRGVSMSSGEYVAFLDADDWWKLSFLSEMEKFISSYSEAGLFACNYIYYKPGKTHVALDVPTGYIYYPKVYCEQSSMPICTGATIMSREVFSEFGGFPVGVNLGEDFLLWSKVAMFNKIAFLNKPLAYYNNDVPVSLRATRNLHAPEHHMLFNMRELEKSIDGLCDIEAKCQWRRLLDMLRVRGLMQYWMNPEYHEIAAKELAKVDWSAQSDAVRRAYRMPLWWLRGKDMFFRVGSSVKNKLITIIVK